MNTVLLNPPLYYYKTSKPPQITTPNGLLYVAGGMKSHGLPFEIVDAIGMTTAENVVTHENGRMRLGIEVDQLIKGIAAKKPDIVGITHYFSAQLESLKDVVETIKRESPSTKVVCGGPGISSAPDFVNKFIPSIDYLVVGEGEEAFPALVKALEDGKDPDGIPGVYSRKDDGNVTGEKPVFIENLDDIPFLDFNLLDLDRYLGDVDNKRYLRHLVTDRVETILPIVTTRGCPNRCFYCAVRYAIGPKWRAHSPDYVLDFVRHIQETTGVSTFRIEDDHFTVDWDRSEEILHRIISETDGIRFQVGNVYPREWSYERLKLFRDAGCTYINFAIESLNEHSQRKLLHRNAPLDEIITNLKICRDLEIETSGLFMIGTPGETLAQMRDSLRKGRRLYWDYNMVPGVSVLTPLPGTPLSTMLTKRNLWDREPTGYEYAVATQTRGLIKTKDFLPEQVQQVYEEHYFLLAMTRALRGGNLRYKLGALKDAALRVRNWLKNGLIVVKRKLTKS